MIRFCKLFIALFLLGCSGNSNEFFYEKKYPDLNNKAITLKHFKKNSFNVFIAFDNNCPLCKASIPSINALLDSFKGLGVVLFYPANPLDKEINIYITELLNSKIIQVKDKNKSITKGLKATVTPQAFVLDAKGILQYNGPIDNSMFGNFRKNYATIEPYLFNALDTLCNQKKILKKNEIKAIGCYIE